MSGRSGRRPRSGSPSPNWPTDSPVPTTPPPCKTSATGSARHIQSFFQRWMSRLPVPLTAADQHAGYWWELSMRQVEVSRTIVFAQPRHARAFFEALVTDNLDLGRPTEIVFDRRIVRNTAHPGHVPDQGHHPRRRRHHQRLLPALPDQAVPQGRPGPADRDRRQLTHRPAAGRRLHNLDELQAHGACDQRPAAAH